MKNSYIQIGSSKVGNYIIFILFILDDAFVFDKKHHVFGRGFGIKYDVFLCT